MKKRFTALFFAVCAVCICMFAFSSCGLDAQSSLKELTHPCIARYECQSATYGGKDILGDFDYIRITLLDESELELAFKQKGKRARAYTCDYTFDEETHELYAEIGALGFKTKEKVKIENGKFTVSFPIGGKQLILNFSE